MRRVIGAAAASAAIALAAPALAKKPLGPSERIDLNRAGVAELMRLPGVGERRAREIVAHRATRPFLRVEDVLAVKGLGPAWFARAKVHLAVGAAPAASAAPAAAPARRGRGRGAGSGDPGPRAGGARGVHPAPRAAGAPPRRA